MNDYQTGYDEGLKEGLKTAEFSDSYWLRTYASAAMQGNLANPANTGDSINDIVNNSMEIAQAILAMVKKCEAENN